MKKILLIVLMVAVKEYTKAQAPNSIAFPSVNNSFLGLTASGSGVGVDLYTGTAQVSIPVCNLSSKDLTIPISFSYTGGRGIRLQEYATCTGLGWQLNAGGSISRVVRGFPDEFSNGYLGTGHWGQQVKNAITNGTGLPSQITGCSGASCGNPSADGEPDIFYVKTPSFGFQFTFDENGEAVVSNSTGVKIIPLNFYNSSTYWNASFKVIDNAGNQYFFGSNSSSVEQTATKLYGTNYTFPTTWYLDKIVTFNSKDVINFSYTGSSTAEVYQHYTTVRSYLYNGCNSTKTDSVTTTVTARYISNITSSVGTVDFTYAYDRRDVINAARLSNIRLSAYTASSSTAVLQNYAFAQSYFGDPTTDKNLLRLKLDKITVAGNTPSTSTAIDYRKFTYYQTENLPSRKSQSFDYWGYYNYPWRSPMANEGDPMSDPTLRMSTDYRAKANILVSVKDMAGGTWELDYENNNYYRTSDNTTVAAGGLRVRSVAQKLATGENLLTLYSYTDNNGNSSGQVSSESYKNLVWVWPNYVNEVLSETPSNIYDINGTFIGYSRVKVTLPSGGNTISTFMNYSDCPDENSYYSNSFDPNTVPNITSTTSRAYKRGLLKSQEQWAASGPKQTEDVYSYIALTSPISKKSWAFKWYTASYNFCSVSGSNSSSTTYSTVVENFRLSQITHRDYDNYNVTNNVEKTVYYGYADNKWQVKSISTSSSKGPTSINRTQTLYYPEDLSIPMLTTNEQSAVSALVLANCTSALIHQTADIGGVVTQTHNSYSVSQADPTKVFLTNTSIYKGNSLAQQQSFNYDEATSNIISSSITGGKPTSIAYGYNTSYAVAKVKNANSTVSYSSGTDYGNMYLNGPTSTSFSVSYSGTVSLSLNFGGYPGSGPVSASINYTLSGPSARSGTLCISAGGASCSYPSSVDLPGIAPGSYTLSYYVLSNNVVTSPYLRYTYPRTFATVSSEFFYEDFEQSGSASIGNAHTGKGYYDGTSFSYSVNYALPNSRSYVIQWWTYSSGKWTMNEQPYTGPRALPGIIDDIRIFPSDALMTTYTYDRIVGKTGEIDPSGKTSTYEYDGMGRVHVVRDNDKNIQSLTCYSIQGKQVECQLFTSQDRSNYYYSQYCGAGQSPDAYWVSVPAGMFTSYSQADADAQAVQYGQAQANSYGSCHSADFPIYGYNSSSYSYTVELYNSNTGQDYWFYLDPWASTTIGYIPEGTYDIYLSSSDYYTYHSYYAGCSYYTSGYGYANFYGVSLNSSCNSINIY